MRQLLVLAIVTILFLALLFPRKIPRVLRRFGRSVGDAGRAGSELLSGEEAAHSPLARYEVQAGQVVEAKVLSENPLSSDAELQAIVREVGVRLAENAHRREIPYRFAVLESSEPNALAVAGGAVFVTRPLLTLCDLQPDAIACVLGHEVIHIDQRHAIRQLAVSATIPRAINLLSLGRGAILSRVVGGMQQLLVQGYRQDQEFEADLFGARLAKLAGYDPRALAWLLERLSAARPDGSGPIAEALQYFRSHPPAAARIARLRKAFAG
jgi:predicted Zn-dependent protease